MTTDIIEPRPFASRLCPAPVGGGLRDPDWWIWCGSSTRDDEGRYHLFASRWPRSYPWFTGYLARSEVVRGDRYLFDLANDPHETRNLIAFPRRVNLPVELDAACAGTHNPSVARTRERGRDMAKRAGGVSKKKTAGKTARKTAKKSAGKTAKRPAAKPSKSERQPPGKKPAAAATSEAAPTAAEGIEAAKQLERDGIAFYSEAASKAATEAMRRTFLSLAEDERKHLAWLEAKSPAAPPPASLNRSLYAGLKDIFAGASGEIRAKLGGMADDIRAIDFAIGMEAKSIEAYSTWERAGESGAVRELGRVLVGVERFHKQLLENAKEFLASPGDWFMLEERWNFEGG
jgi:rubrerythrin